MVGGDDGRRLGAKQEGVGGEWKRLRRVLFLWWVWVVKQQLSGFHLTQLESGDLS